MGAPLNIPLHAVVDRNGRKIATSIRTENWDEEEVFVVQFGENPNHAYGLSSLFHYVLSDGLAEFVVLDDQWASQDIRIPGGEIRALVRQVMQHRNVGAGYLKVSVQGRAELVESCATPGDAPF